MNKTHSRHATAPAFILPAFCFIAPHAGAVRNCTPEPAGPPRPPGPAAVWLTHILPRGDLVMGELNWGRVLRSCRQFLDRDVPMPLEPFAIPLKPADVMADAMRRDSKRRRREGN
jgi:hypothetical protein